MEDDTQDVEALGAVEEIVPALEDLEPAPGVRRPGEILLRLPVDEVAALRGWAGLYGRGIADEVRIAIQIHLMHHALAHIEQSGDALGGDEMDPAQTADAIRGRLEERKRTAYERPSTAGLVLREAGDDATLEGVGG